ncbi:MAG: PIN domain-containing protein [Candidatus Azobacteroides sp.]|nr:PIN domain-containing protein [Candidatus Azobacteroides sp.]
MQNIKSFIDSNIIIYAYSVTEKNKQNISETIISQSYSVISIQVLQEIANILHRKFGKNFVDVKNTLLECASVVNEIHVNTQQTVIYACDITQKYGYSFYDSLIIAAAIESGCSLLYSEDMQHNQLIEGKLKIVNPFL